MAKFGIKDAKKREEFKFVGGTCTNCFREDSLYGEVFARYFHIYHIPCFRIQKYALAVCEDCRHVIQQKDIPEELKEQAKGAKKKIKFSIKHFTGLILFCIVLVYGLIRRVQIRNNDLSYIEQPQPNDLYTIKIEGGYSLLKLAVVKGDSIGFYETKDQISKYLKIKGLQRRAVFEPDTLYLTKSLLLEQLENGKIIQVERE